MDLHNFSGVSSIENKVMRKEVFRSTEMKYFFEDITPEIYVYTLKEEKYENYQELINKVFAGYSDINGNNFNYDLEKMYIKINNNYCNRTIYFVNINKNYFKRRILKRISKGK